MSGLVQRVRSNVTTTCTVAQMNKEGCSVFLDGVPADRLIIDLDKPGSPLGQNATRCDYLLFADDNSGADWVAALELTRGPFGISKFANQLNAGAQAAQSLVSAHTKVKFRPVAVFGGGMRKAERNVLRRRNLRVRFRGKFESLRRIKCGAQLIDALR